MDSSVGLFYYLENCWVNTNICPFLLSGKLLIELQYWSFLFTWKTIHWTLILVILYYLESYSLNTNIVPFNYLENYSLNTNIGHFVLSGKLILDNQYYSFLIIWKTSDWTLILVILYYLENYSLEPILFLFNYLENYWLNSNNGHFILYGKTIPLHQYCSFLVTWKTVDWVLIWFIFDYLELLIELYYWSPLTIWKTINFMLIWVLFVYQEYYFFTLILVLFSYLENN